MTFTKEISKEFQEVSGNIKEKDFCCGEFSSIVNSGKSTLLCSELVQRNSKKERSCCDFSSGKVNGGKSTVINPGSL